MSDIEMKKGRKPIAFTDDVIQTILVSVQRNKPFSYSRPVIARFIEETGFVERVPNMRLPGEKGAVGFSLAITPKGKDWLIRRIKSLTEPVRPERKVNVSRNRDALHSKMLDMGHRLLKKAEALESNAAAHRKEVANFEA